MPSLSLAKMTENPIPALVNFDSFGVSTSTHVREQIAQYNPSFLVKVSGLNCQTAVDKFLGLLLTLKESSKYSPIETSAVAVIEVSTVARKKPSNILSDINFKFRLLVLRGEDNEDQQLT